MILMVKNQSGEDFPYNPMKDGIWDKGTRWSAIMQLNMIHEMTLHIFFASSELRRPLILWCFRLEEPSILWHIVALGQVWDFKKYKTKTLNMSISISLSSSVEKHSRTFI
jgi:hypothetical protein